MEHRRIGKSAIYVSDICMGTMTFGSQTDEAEAHRILDKCLDAGINFFDTAEGYPVPPDIKWVGRTEDIVGRWMKGKNRDAIIMATKVSGPSHTWFKSPKRGGMTTLDRHNIITAVEESLRRLQTDYIDLIQLHEAETKTFDVAIEGCLLAFADLKKAGVVRAIGVNGRDIATLLPYIESGLIDTTLVFCRYMLIDTTILDALVPAAQLHDVAIINGSPLGMGVMTDVPAPFLRNDTALPT
jgi:aryl-alcohol dehydrogenase-like predicted oxidoreductase